MPLPPGLARFNRVVTNRIVLRFADTRHGFAVIEHRGRVSGRAYRTPVNCWGDGDSLLIALTYGEEVDWLKNLRHAGGGAVHMEGRRFEVGVPRILGGEGMERLPTLARRVLGVIGVLAFVELPVLRPGRPT